MEERVAEKSKIAGQSRRNWKSDAEKMNEALKVEGIDSAIMEIITRLVNRFNDSGS